MGSIVSEQKYSRRRNESSERSYDRIIHKIEQQLKIAEKDKFVAIIDYIYRIKKIETILLNSNYILSFQYRSVYKESYILLLEHFSDRIDDYLNYTDQSIAKIRTYRTEVCYEIDQAIGFFWRMIEQDSQSVWNANRITNPSNPGITAISYVSPKLYGYYSNLLNDLSKIYTVDGERKTYSFCVNPTPEGNCEAIVLFEGRRKHGKVCLIKLPEINIAKVNDNQFNLLHEFFHVLPREIRLRKERYEILWDAISFSLSYFISVADESGIGIYQLFTCMLNIKKDNAFFEIHPEDDYQYYSANAKRNLFSEFTRILRELISSDTNVLEWTKEIKKNESIISKDDWEMVTKCLTNSVFLDSVSRIENTIRSYCDDNPGEIRKLIDTAIYITKECFSDVLSILSLSIKPQQYISILEKNISVTMTDKIEDGYKVKLRCYFVSETMRQVLERFPSRIKWNKWVKVDRDFLKSWEKGLNIDRDSSALYKSFNSFITQIQNYNLKGYFPLWILLIKNNDVKDKLCSYLIKCSNQWADLQIRNEKKFSDLHRRMYLCNPIFYNKTEEKRNRYSDISILEKIAGMKE